MAARGVLPSVLPRTARVAIFREPLHQHGDDEFWADAICEILIRSVQLEGARLDALARRRGDGAVFAARISACLRVPARSGLGAGRADPDRAVAAAHQRRGPHLRLDRDPGPARHRQHGAPRSWADRFTIATAL